MSGDIDWTKPVEMLRAGQWIPVVFSMDIPDGDGDRYCVFVYGDGKYPDHSFYRHGSIEFRNVPEPVPAPPAIDWMKPVECRASRGDWWPVKWRTENRDGCFVVVVECPDDGSLQLWTEQDLTFRNVRRQVKHKEEFHFVLTKRGFIRRFASADIAKDIAEKDGDEYRYHVEEWEVESDE